MVKDMKNGIVMDILYRFYLPYVINVLFPRQSVFMAAPIKEFEILIEHLV
jgi:hypothetical protein